MESGEKLLADFFIGPMWVPCKLRQPRTGFEVVEVFFYSHQFHHHRILPPSGANLKLVGPGKHLIFPVLHFIIVDRDLDFSSSLFPQNATKEALSLVHGDEHLTTLKIKNTKQLDVASYI